SAASPFQKNVGETPARSWARTPTNRASHNPPPEPSAARPSVLLRIVKRATYRVVFAGATVVVPLDSRSFSVRSYSTGSQSGRRYQIFSVLQGCVKAFGSLTVISSTRVLKSLR